MSEKPRKVENIKIDIDEDALYKTVEQIRVSLLSNLENMFKKLYCEENNIKDWKQMVNNFRVFLLQTNEGRSISSEPIKTILTPIMQEIRRRGLRVNEFGLYPLAIDDKLIKAMQHVIYERANYEEAFAKRNGGVKAEKGTFGQKIRKFFLSIV